MKFYLIALLLLALTSNSWAQLTVRGTVKNEKDQPLPGAAVYLKPNQKGTATNAEGRFSFNQLKAGNYILSISFMGYKKKEIPLHLNSSQQLNISLQPSQIMTDAVLVAATRAGTKTPVAQTNLDKETIRKNSTGQDIPYLLNQTPSFVTTSDAGTGIGYTSFRIRGSDLNRINVTVDGIPMNDSESHDTYFVDIPDIASSTNNIQIQRGVGTSTNGTASFGASIDVQTSQLKKEAYGDYTLNGGSFGTVKNTLSAGSGLLNKHFAVDLRLSKLNSDGFIDRATADLKSFYSSAGYYSPNSVLKLIVFSGHERTYQAWNGVPSVKLNNDQAGMKRYLDHMLWSSSERENELRYENLVNSNARTYNMYTYKNAVDDYQQDHYQLHFYHQFRKNLNFHSALFYTRGKGYFENYKYDQSYDDYLMTAPDGITQTDMAVRKWLSNDFYGIIYSLSYQGSRSDFIFGGGYNYYDGRHFGRVIWAQYYGSNSQDFQWYYSTGQKQDFNTYARYNYQLNQAINLYADMQYRYISYSMDGTEDKLNTITQDHYYNFLNPKAGISLDLDNFQKIYFSYALSHREPNRSNYIDKDTTDPIPVPECLNDFEASYHYKHKTYSLEVNFYYMSYKNQLVLTGEVNDVGSNIMRNVDHSYRSGIEISGIWQINKKFNWNLNATFSKNKIRHFAEGVDDWDTGEQDLSELSNTDLSFSPNTVVNNSFSFNFSPRLNISLLSNYVSQQYIDNTSSENRKLDSYFVSNLQANYTLKNKFVRKLNFHIRINNLFNEKYETNAWVYSYIYEGERYKMDGYFPQAGTNFLAGIDINF